MKILSITVDKLPSACIVCFFLRNGFCPWTKENVNSVCQTERGEQCILSANVELVSKVEVRDE